jgi:hypothetical protein
VEPIRCGAGLNIMRTSHREVTPHDPRNAVNAPAARRDAVCADVQRLLGAIATDKIVAIMALRPSLAELEEAALWVQGENYLLGRHPLVGIAARIFEIAGVDANGDGSLP